MKNATRSGLVFVFFLLFSVALVPAQTINTTTLLNSSAEPACVGQAVTLTAVVASSPAGLGTPTGSVDFWADAGWYLGSGTLDGNGQTTLVIDSLSAGSHSLTAEYGGDATFAYSISPAISQTINTSPTVTQNPVNQSVCTGTTASFSAAATASPAPAVQWQLSTDNGVTFTDIAGATAGTYTFSAILANNGSLYRAKFTNSCGAIFSSAATLTVWPRPTATVTGTTTICAGSSASLLVSLIGTAPWTVAWSDGFTNNNIMSSPLTRSVSPSSSTTFTITSVSDADCTGTPSGSAVVTVNTAPTVTVNPVNQSACPATSVSFTAAASGSPAPKIQWQVSTDGGTTFVAIPAATNTTYSFATVAGDNSKQFRAQFSNTCAIVSSAPASLTVYPTPNCSISGADAVCAGSANQSYAAPAGLAAYRWTISGAGTISGPANTATVAVNAGASGSFTLSLALTNSNGCSSTCTKTVNITALPTAVVSGGGSICSGGSATIQAALTGVGPWTLTWSDGFIQTAPTSPATRSVSPAVSTNYSVTSVTDANCSNAGSGSATVTVNTAPVVTANPSSQAACPATTVSFSASASGSPAPKIQWQVSTDGGTTFVAIPAATNPTYTFATVAGDNGKQFRAQFSNTCAVVSSSPALLTVYVVPACSISGADAVCASSLNQTYSAPAGLAAYLWSVTGSGTISGPANGLSVTINAGASGTFTVSLTLTNANGCSSTCTKTVTITPLPTAVVSGGGAICPGGSATIQAALTGTSPWTLTWSDGLVQSNVAVSPATRSVSPNIATNYTVTRVSDANCSNIGSGNASVTINSAPVVTVTPTDKAVCASSAVTFSASASGSPAPAVQWQASGDGGVTFTNVAGATSATYTFTTSLSDSGKRFRAVFTNVCGSATSGSAGLLVNPLPSATITASSVVCANSTGNSASVPSGGAGAGYNWSVSGGTITSGAGTPNITYTAGSSGTISLNVTVSNAFGCTASSSQSVTFATQNKNLEGWKNKAPLQWQGSTFNVGDHQYSEGNTIPLRLELTQMCPGVPWCLVLRYDFKDGNTARHFYDFLGTYDASEPTVNGHELDGFVSSDPPTTFPIPVDSSLSYQLPGNFTVYNGAITNVSSYSVVSGSTICKQLTIQGYTTAGGGVRDVLILFGGHLARENEWGAGNGASSFPGASAKVDYQFCGASSFGNFGVNPAGIIKQADLSLTKTASPNPLCAGNTLTYSLVVANAGPDQASPVTVSDVLPQGMTVSLVNMSQGTWSGTTNLSFALGAVNAGSNATISIVVTVNTNTAMGTVTNTATVSAGAPADPYMLNNTASATTMIFPHPSATPLLDQVVCRGAPVTFSTSAIGAPPFTYQWMKNGLSIAGATNSSFSIASASATDAGTYCVIVSSQCNSVTDVVTNCATLTINADTTASPLIAQTICPGQNATFSTTPAGAGPFTFTWTKDGVPIPGASSSALTITNATADNVGLYCVQVIGACTTANSCAMLSVRTNTTATVLISQTNCPGQAVTFATVASGTGPFSYVWRKDGTTIAGATASALTLSSVSAAQAGTYCVEVTGLCNTVTNCATLTIRTLTTVDPLLALTNCPGAAATFSTIAHGDGPFTYQWTKDGVALSGQTSNVLVLPNPTATDAGTYAVQVTGPCNSVTNAATLTINQNAFVATSPANATVCPGANASFTVVPGGTGPFQYQWSKGSVLLAGQTSATLTLANVSAADADTYTVTVTGACGNAVSAGAVLTVNQNVAVVIPPTGITNCPGSTATFTVTAGGTGPFGYQWFKGSSPISGQTNSILVLTNVTAGDSGSYTVTINGGCGPAVSASANLTVRENLIVLAAPLSLTNCPDSTAVFTISANGTGLNYQWFKGSTALAGQTYSTLTLPAVTAADTGTYGVVINSSCGGPITNLATLTINTPTTADAPVSVTNCPGTAVTFNTTAHGTGPFSYQWLKDGSPLSGQTGASLTLPAITAANGGTYSVRVTGACNSTTVAATLTVNSPVTATPLVSQTVCPGAALSLSTSAQGTGPFTYQWIKDGKPLPGATSTSWVITNATVLDNGTYWVIVRGACNAVTNTGTVTVHPPTTLTPLVSQTNCFGQTATFSTIPSGTGPFTFTWSKNGVVLAGATASSLTISHLKASDAGTYSVQVTGLCDSTNSSATLAVQSDGLVSPATFANPASIAINDFSAASPYPSTIEVSCVSGPLTDITVTLTNVSHTYSSDIDILLVGPAGQSVMLMSDTGGGNAVRNATLSFNDAAARFLPQFDPISSGLYKPTDYPPADNLPDPAPLGPYATNLTAFAGTDPNGTWSLYVVDDALADSGTISGGWSLTLSWALSSTLEVIAPTLISAGGSTITLQGQSGQTYILEASTDLRTWTPLATNTLLGATWNYVDPNRTNFAARFYRAVSHAPVN